MEIRLGTIKQEKSGPSIKLEDEISETQYNDLLDAIKEIHTLESNKRLFEIVFLNKNDFVDTLNRDIKEMIKSSLSLAGNRTQYYQHHLNFNRLFLNYLSSIKTFIDHNEKKIKNNFGDESKEAKEFKNITHYYFNNFFCYRFFVKLRDYGQHCGMPLSDFGLSTHRNPDGSYISTANIEFDPKQLLETFSGWKKDVTKDLEQMQSKFPLAPLIENMTKVLLGFWQAMDAIYTDKICKATIYIKGLADHLRSDNTDVCIFTNIQDNEDGSLKKFETLTIPFDIIDMLDVSC
ncbi:MAG: hypothetical protein JNK50_01420 [Bacteroidia bacterium]|nr:hypothetical protein [Bacteroidia bacterium]